MTNAKHQDLKAKDGTKLVSYEWPTATSPAFGLFLLHGHGEHCGMYQSFVEQIQRIPCVVGGVDYRGHGLSEGLRGHAMSLSEVVEDARTALQAFQQKYPKLPLVLFGHSMGGGVLARLLCEGGYPSTIVGAILSSPLLSPKLSAIQKLQMVLAKLLSSILPRMIVPANHDLSMLSTEPEVEAEIKADPLFHTQISLALGADFSRNGDYCVSKAQDIKTPLLVYWGNDDVFVKVELVEAFYQKLTSPKNKVLFPGVRHVPHMAAPAVREEVYKLLRQTIQDFSSKAPR